jgi:hypothetical protein
MKEKLVIENGIPIPRVTQPPRKTGRVAFLRTFKKGQSVLLRTTGANARSAAVHAFGTGCYVSREVVRGKAYRIWRKT